MKIENKRCFVFIGVILAMAAALLFLLSGCDSEILDMLESEYLQSDIADPLRNESFAQSTPHSEDNSESAPEESVSQPEESSASISDESASQPVESLASISEESASQPEESSASVLEESASQPEESFESVSETEQLHFRSQKLLKQHYEKHGIEMGFDSAEEYEKAAAAVVLHPDVLHKIEAEDGDDVYYIESTNEFVVVSTDGYLRTYFNPDRGIDYFNKQ